MENKKYKTAAALRRLIEERLAAEKLDLVACRADVNLIEARIDVLSELLDSAEPVSGKEAGENGGEHA